MTSTYIINDSDDEYEHWSSNSQCLNTHTYHASNEEARESPPPISPVLSAISTAPLTTSSHAAEMEEPKLTQLPIQYAQAALPVIYAHPLYYAAMPVTPAAPAAAPAPAFTKSTKAKSAKATIQKAPKSSTNGKEYTYHPHSSEPKRDKTNYWTGRTKEEVDDDNKKIAAAEKTNEKRKIVPVNVDEDQVFWVLEIDGKHTLQYVRALICYGILY